MALKKKPINVVDKTTFERNADKFLVYNKGAIQTISKTTIEADPSRGIIERARILNLAPGEEVDTGYGRLPGLFIIYNTTRGRTGLFSLHPYAQPNLHVLIADAGATISLAPSSADGKILIYRKTDNGNVFVKNNYTETQNLSLLRVGE